jgi:hypothetical protein
MRTIRWLGVAAGLATLMALATGTVLAGGWAEVTMLDGSGDPPIAGEEREIRFQLLQHGVTAVDFGDVDLTAVDPATGQAITVAATNHGGGNWSAVVTFPVDWNWQISVAHSGLLTSEPTTMVVGRVDGIAGLGGAISIGVFALMAIVVVGSALLIGRGRRPSVAEPTAAVVRAG